MVTLFDSVEHQRSAFTRRNVLRAAAAAMTVPAVARNTMAFASDRLAGSGELIVQSVGGGFTQGIRKYVWEPFTKATGIKIVDVVADVAEPQVKAMKEAGRVDWDVAFIQSSQFRTMDEAGMFAPIEYSFWDAEALDGVPAAARLKSGVAVFATAQLLAYDKRLFGGNGPKNWGDFWNVNDFPGPRGLTALPSTQKNNIVFALLADGVAKSDIWPLTDEKIDRALKKLDQIRPHVTKWWTSGGEPPQLLINRELVMTSCYDGRAISAIRQGAPIAIAWDGAYVNFGYITVLKGGPNTENGQRLVAFLNRAAIAAGNTVGTGYPGPNIHQLDHLPADLVPLLSIGPENASKVVYENSDWLAAKLPDGKTNLDQISQRTLKWRVQ